MEIAFCRIDDRMQERLYLLHGTVEYRSANGFIVEVKVPLSGGGGAHD